jgi:hypothetical protein
MKRGLVLLAVAAWLGSAGVTTAADAGLGFDAYRDAYKVSDCLNAYKLLEEATLGLKPDVFETYERAHLVSWKRIRPFVHASVRAIGDREFYRHISPSNRAAEILLRSDSIYFPGVRDALVQSLSTDAKACDDLVIGWGPPPKE